MDPNGEFLPEDDLDETFGERLAGLTEMFPESLRSGCSKICRIAGTGITSAYGFSRTYTWIFFSSAAILMAPVIIQSGLQDFEEMAKAQQREMLLGPAGR